MVDPDLIKDIAQGISPFTFVGLAINSDRQRIGMGSPDRLDQGDAMQSCLVHL